MNRHDIHDSHDFFEYVRVDGAAPPAERTKIDIAILDMNHSWPNLGHDSLVHLLLEAAESWRDRLVAAGTKIRALSFDIRRKQVIPDPPNGRFGLYVGTGGPGHLDPRLNDGETEPSQGIRENADWEAPLFRLFDDILSHPTAGLIAVCHSFGLLCRWSGAAHVELRAEKSSGMPTNVLSAAAGDHPWFARFARQLPDGRHFRVVDNRLFDLVLDGGDITPIAFERDGSGVVTTAEFARAGTMPRMFGTNHHPEIVDREHLLLVLEEKRRHGEVTEKWYRERSNTLETEMRGEVEQQSRLTSEYTLAGPLRFHIERLVEERT